MAHSVKNECKDEQIVDKLPIEPDKQKLNIFKKISSKPKEELQTKHVKEQMSYDTTLNGMLASNIKQEDRKSTLNNPIACDSDTKGLMSSGTNNYSFEAPLLTDSNISNNPEFTGSGSISEICLQQQSLKRKKKDKTEKKKRGPKVKTPKNILKSKKVKYCVVLRWIIINKIYDIAGTNFK